MKTPEFKPSSQTCLDLGALTQVLKSQRPSRQQRGALEPIPFPAGTLRFQSGTEALTGELGGGILGNPRLTMRRGRQRAGAGLGENRALKFVLPSASVSSAQQCKRHTAACDKGRVLGIILSFL